VATTGERWQLVGRGPARRDGFSRGTTVGRDAGRASTRPAGTRPGLGARVVGDCGAEPGVGRARLGRRRDGLERGCVGALRWHPGGARRLCPHVGRHPPLPGVGSRRRPGGHAESGGRPSRTG
jgi:hypothetical protein